MIHCADNSYLIISLIHGYPFREGGELVAAVERSILSSVIEKFRIHIFHLKEGNF